MIKLSNRLLSLTKYVHPDDVIMDVGCDHAKLDIYLVQTGLINKIYVCDVNPNALQNGILNIEKYNLENNVIPILGYGIEKASDYNIDTLIISGMGSKNIIDILSSPYSDKIYKLILQSNTNHYELRKFLSSKNFKIVEEEIIEDANKTYINIIAIKDYHEFRYSEKEFMFGPILIENENNIEYFKNLQSSFEKIHYQSRSEEIELKLKYLEEIIEDLENKSNLV